MEILSRAALLALVKANPKEHSAVVIHEFGKRAEVEEIIRHCKKCVVLEMDDIISDRLGGPTKEQVQEALASGFEIVACKQGVSRSAAIAFLMECQKKSPEEAIKLLDEKKHYPNELILKFGLELIGDSIKNPVREFFKKLAAHKGWSWEPHNLVTKFFKD